MPVFASAGSSKLKLLRKFATALVRAASLRACVMKAASFVPSDDTTTAAFRKTSLRSSTSSGAGFARSSTTRAASAASMPLR